MVRHIARQRHYRDARRLPARLAAARRRLLSLGAASPGANEGTTSSGGNGTWNSSLIRALKASVVLDPAVLAGVVVQNGLAKVTLRVAVPHKTIVAEVNAKTLRRTIAAITAAGPDAVAVVLQAGSSRGTFSPRPASRLS